MDVINFDPTVEQLNKIVESTSKITAEDLSDDKQLAVVKENRLALRTARTTIEKQGKSMREEAVKYQKDVIAREKELIAIIEPEEIRLKALEDEAAIIKIRAARKELLPMRREQLLPFKDVGVPLLDEMLLDMDNDAFIKLLVDLQSQKNERDRLEIEKQKADLAEAARLEQVRKDAEIAERNRLEAISKADEERRVNEAAEKKAQAERDAQKLIDDAKIEAERVAQEARDAIAVEAAREEARRRASEVEAQRIKDAEAAQTAKEKYLEWAHEQGWTPELANEFETKHINGSIELWKRVGVYTVTN